MFLNIRLKNFLSFKDIDVSFGKAHPLDHALFYGENGAGKTNFIQSISFLRESTATLKAEAIIQKSKRSEYIERFPIPDLSEICRNARTNGSTDNMLVHYEMIIDGGKTEYEMEFSGNTLVHEILKIRLKKKTGVLFEIKSTGTDIDKYLWTELITDPAFRTEVSGKIDRLWGKHSFLAILNREYLENNRNFMDTRVHKVQEVLDYIEKILVSVKPVLSDFRQYNYSFLQNLESGIIGDGELNVLDAYGRALKKFFRRIYHNVTDVYYQKTPVGSGVSYNLMFRKKLDGAVVDIPSVRESFGTRKLVQMFHTLIGCASGQVAFIDEIDSGIHDKLIQDLLPQVFNDINGQLIITTHNTGILRKISPKNVFVIDVDAEGFKRIHTFNSEIRTMTNNNNQNRYLNNAVGGVPFIGTVDLKSIAEGLESDLVM